MPNIEFLSKVRVNQFVLAKKWNQEVNAPKRIVRGQYIEKMPNRYPDDVYTVIGEVIVNEGFWMPSEGGPDKFVTDISHQLVLVAKGLRVRFKAVPEDLELVEEEDPAEELAQTQEVVPLDNAEPADNRPLIVWKIAWEDGTNEWVAARDKEEAAATLQHHTGIGHKDLEDVTITREDMRKSFYKDKKSIRFGAYIKTITKPTYICQDIQE